MLAAIREKTQGIIATFILLLLVIPFALWGINSYFGGGSKLDVATVNGVDITQQAYRTALDRLRGQVAPDVLNQPAVKRKVLQGLIDRQLLMGDARRQHYWVDNADLAALIRGLPYFQRDGRFDPRLYATLLAGRGMTPARFEASLRGELLTGQIRVGLTDSAFVTGTDLAGVARLLGEERHVSYVVVSTGSVAAPAPPDDTAIKAYYDAHPKKFRTPGEVQVQYLELSAQDLARTYTPTADDLRRLYRDEGSRFTVPERRWASHILIALPPAASPAEVQQALTKIESIRRRARTAAEFAALARQYSQDAATRARGGDLGEIRPGLLPKPLEDAIDDLKPGEVSEPIRTQYGYHLARLTRLVPSRHESFDEVRAELVKILRRRKGEKRFFDLSEKFQDRVYERPDSLAPAAAALGLPVETSAWFTRQGGTGIAAYPKVVQAAFSPDVLIQGHNSDAVAPDPDTLVALRVVGHHAASREPLAAVRAQIVRILEQRQADQAAHRLGETLLQELRGGALLPALARTHHLVYQGPVAISREHTAGLDPRLVEAAFRALAPIAGTPSYAGVDLGAGGYALLAVQGVSNAGTAATPAIEAEARQALLRRSGADYYRNYRDRLRAQAKIKIYDERL